MMQGIFEMTMQEYLSDPAPEPSLTRSVIHKLLTRTPTHAWRDHPRLGARSKKPSRRADFGSAAHQALLGGQDLVVIDAADYRTKAARAARDEAKEAGKIPLLAEEHVIIQEMMAESMRMLDALKLKGLPERTLIWQEEGVWFRCRPDLICETGDILVDYKTAANADPQTWVRRALFPGGYDVQAALYTRGMKAITGRDYRFLFLAQELEEPYACSVVEAGPQILELGNAKVGRAVSIWRQCMATGEWPRYGYQVYQAEIPAYERYDWEERSGE